MGDPDLRFLGEQIKRMQGELRGVRAEQLRLESEQALLRADVMDRLESFEKSVDARFEQAHQTMATNLTILLEAIKGNKA